MSDSLTEGQRANLEHIRKVQDLVQLAIRDLEGRAARHDASKLQPPEAEYYDKYVPLLRTSEYASAEYMGFLRAMEPALTHHYQANDHHPEHFDNHIDRMNLLQLLEMVLDWKAATMRHATGDILKSIELNQQRFGYSDELKAIFLNTIRYLKLAE
jgi:hypothetical protein